MIIYLCMIDDDRKFWNPKYIVYYNKNVMYGWLLPSKWGWKNSQ